MKKHLFGFAIFSFVFTSCAIAFALFYMPMIPQITQTQITQIERIDKPLCAFDSLDKCEKKFGSIRFDIISTVFNLNENKLISKIKMNLGDCGKKPTSIMVGTDIYTVENIEAKNVKIDTKLIDIFESTQEFSNEVIFYVESDVSNKSEISSKDNLYAMFYFDTTYADNRNIESFDITSEIIPVLFVHGKSSIIEK